MDANGESRIVVPTWLRPVAAGCGLVALLLVLLMVGGLMAPNRVLGLGVVAIRQRTLRALPAETPQAERERLERGFQCVLAAISAGRLDREGVAPLGAASSAALRDGRLTVEEVKAIAAAAQTVCRSAAGGQE